MKEAKHDFFVLHSGQHYSYRMDAVFFENLGLEPPEINLGVGSGSHAEETGKMLIGIEKALLDEGATGVLVEGDTNTVLAGALVAAKLQLKVGHIEAGLRSNDRLMPEELNRVVVDHLSDCLFAPTERSKRNLLQEGICSSNVLVTGNTVVDAIQQNLEFAEKSAATGIFSDLPSSYLLATVHRQENVDRPRVLASLFRALDRVAERTGMPVIYPAHPRTKQALKTSGLSVDPHKIRITDPVNYFEFLRLEKNAELILTDSGGVQEEACILMVPCVTLRDSTERPETVQVGANVVAGTETAGIVRSAQIMLRRSRTWKNPFGDGRAAQRIVKSWTDQSSRRAYRLS